MKGTLAYFVNDVSTSFVTKDLRLLCERYERVLLFSIEPVDELHLLPGNVILFDEFMDWKRYDAKSTLLRFLPSILIIYIYECLASRRLLPFKTVVALLASNIFKASEVSRHLREQNMVESDVDLYYSFWFYDCIFLAWLKRSHRGIKAVTRAHGGDLFEDRDSINDRPLMRHFQLKHLDQVYSVSEMGTRYLHGKYPRFKQKIRTIFLGSDDYGVLNRHDPDKLVIVSVASIRHMKRIHAIAEALSHTSSEISWYHFGNENLQSGDPSIPEYLKWKTVIQSMPNVHYHPMGFRENAELMKFYSENPVSLFVSLSAAEGIPVSMMEAISFGIPILSTDVGGCSEIVNDSTGILIPFSTGPEEIAKFLDGFLNSTQNSEAFRANARAYWSRHFNAGSNYISFFNSLDQLLS